MSHTHRMAVSNCERCGLEFEHRAVKQRLFCSNLCAARTRGALRAELGEIGATCPLNWQTCVSCGAERLAPGRPTARRRCGSCSEQRQKQKRRAYYQQEKPKRRAYYQQVTKQRKGFGLRPGRCGRCGLEFIGHGGRLYCSDKCGRRARGDMPDISIESLGQRDGWRCHLCGKSVRREEATRDHLLPRSLGGSNRATNLRLAHMMCNAKRGNRGPAQLALVTPQELFRRGR